MRAKYRIDTRDKKQYNYVRKIKSITREIYDYCSIGVYSKGQARAIVDVAESVY